MLGISVLLAANDTSDDWPGGAGETPRGCYWSGQGAGIPDETLLGQRQTHGRPQTCIYHAWRAQDVVIEPQELLRIVYPFLLHI